MLIELADQKAKYAINPAQVAYVENATAGRYVQTRIVFVGERSSAIVIGLSYEEVVRQLSILTKS